MYRTWNNKSLTSDKAFYGQNPPNGAMINFYLKEPLGEKETVNITIQDLQGQTVRTINCTKTAPPTPTTQGQGGGGGGGRFGGGGGQPCIVTQGINRYVWDMRSRPVGPQLGPEAGGAGGGGFGAALAQLGLRVDPGDYMVKVKLGDKELSKPLQVVEDPRIIFSADDRAKKKAALTKLQPLVPQSTIAQFTIVNLRTNLNTAIESWKRPGSTPIPDNVKKAADDLL